MLTAQIKKLLLKIQEDKIKKIKSSISKPMKSFDEAIIRVKNLISIGNLNEAETILNSLLSLEATNLEKIINSELNETKKDTFQKEYDNKLFRIKNLHNLIKGKKLGVSFTNVEEFGYTETISIIKQKIREKNFIDARLFLMKSRQKEQNLYNIIIGKKQNSYLQNIKYKFVYNEKLKVFFDLEIAVFYNELFKEISTYSNTQSLIKILKYIIKKKEFSSFEQLIPKIKSFEEKLLNDVNLTKNLSSSYKRKYDSRYNLVINIIKKMHSFYYKEKTGLSIDLSSVRTVNDTFIVINDFAKSYNFSKALEALSELRNKESNSFEAILGDQTITQKYKDKLLKKFRKFESTLNVLEKKVNKNKAEYERVAHLKDLKIRNNQIDKQLQTLLSQNNYDEAFDLLESYKKGLGKDIDKYAIFCEKAKFKILKAKQKFSGAKKKKQDLLEQAKTMMGEQIDVSPEDLMLEKDIGSSFYSLLKSYYTKYKFINKTRNDKLLLDNIESLLKSSKNIKDDVVKAKMEKIHSGLVKDTDGVSLDGYSIYGRTLGADKISGDTFGFYDYNNGKRFFIGDATGHGVRAGFMISLLTSSFHSLVKTIPNLKDLVVALNNKLKQDLKSGNFITSIFFEISYKEKNEMKFIGMGHEPMFFYKKSTMTVDKVYPGGVAAGMTMLKDQAFLKEKSMTFEIGDVLLLYTDGLVEARNENGDMFSIDRIKEVFFKGVGLYSDAKDIYNYIYQDLTSFVNKTKFLDDLTIIVIKRDSKKESLNEEKIIENILATEHVSKKFVKKLKGQSREQIETFLKAKRKERELSSILKNLRAIFKTGDLVSLKKESQRYIKEGFIHKDIVKYLSYSIENEVFAKIEQQNMRLQNKYETLLKLLKSGRHETVLEEASNIIMSEGKI
ncbi:MAG: PP2C family protein-serine/threonine phosphatase [Candidatus Gracilibacteria bacterium]|nr:PP2C family protein-serine/threonine phosphatase [Candidatus Gracilibacteria bacterium]